MRHAPLEFADQIADLKSLGHTWDSVFCTDMRDVAAFKGLTDLGSIPITVYFHENQFAYLNRRAAEADLHFAFTNFTTLVAADRVWFNSQFNLDATMDGAQRLLKRFPDFRPLGHLETIRRKSSVQSPGVEVPAGDASVKLIFSSADSEMTNVTVFDHVCFSLYA